MKAYLLSAALPLLAAFLLWNMSADARESLEAGLTRAQLIQAEKLERSLILTGETPEEARRLVISDTAAATGLAAEVIAEALATANE